VVLYFIRDSQYLSSVGLITKHFCTDCTSPAGTLLFGIQTFQGETGVEPDPLPHYIRALE
jgi:hypothetical protein